MVALTAGGVSAQESDPSAAALDHAHEASLALRRAHDMLLSWSARKDTASSLIRGGGPDGESWTVAVTAARLYPALVLASWLTDAPLHDGLLRETLRDEARFTSRLGALPDDYHLSAGSFVNPVLDAEAAFDNAAAYAHGLSLIVQREGEGPWADRLRSLVDAIFAGAAVATSHADGPLPSESASTNGYLLRVLPLLSSLARDDVYLSHARRIGDAYTTAVLPHNGGLPADRWDFATGRPRASAFTLDEGGAALVQGLTLLYAIEAAGRTERAEGYRAALQGMFDILLSRALSDDGSAARRILPDGKTGDRRRRASNPGRILSAAHVFGTLTGEDRLLRAVSALSQKGASAADEPAEDLPDLLSLHARLGDRERVGIEMRPLLARLLSPGMGRGIDQAADADVLRALLASAWFHTAGVRAVPWRKDILIGAAFEGDDLHLVVRSGTPWSGRLAFDRPRSRSLTLQPAPLPFDHGFPEWFVLDPGGDYRFRVQDGTGPAVWSGSLLAAGLPVSLRAGGTVHLTVRLVPRPAASAASVPAAIAQP